MPPKKKADTAPATKKYKIGDIAEVEAGELVRRPDGTVVTSGGGHVLNVVGEYAFVSPNGDERTITVSEK